MKEPIYVGLTTAKASRFIVVVILTVVAVRAFNARGQTLTVLHSFTGSPDGQQPFVGLVQGSDGNFYGTTHNGGTYNWGAVYRVNSAGTLTTLYSFPYDFNGGSNGASPSIFGTLVQGSDGYFYGTTYMGGTHDTGIVFKINSAGTLTTLHNFAGADGGGPEGGVVKGRDGYFYGTTYWGGTNGAGTVFQVSSTGTFTTLYQFNGGTDGGHPYAGLVQGGDGYFYGTTVSGGSNTWGTAFQISSAGTLTTLHNFGFTDGVDPWGPLVQGNDGYLYGTTSVSGPNGGGTVFRLSSAGTFATVYAFNGGSTNAHGPEGGLLLGSDGNFYGTTYYGGKTNASSPYDAGTVFMVTPAGTLTTLYEFNGPDGGSPTAALAQGIDGSFYGTTGLGGTCTSCGFGYGTVFKLTVPLNPPPNQISALQVAGSNLTISVPSVAYETYQLQFSSSMSPTNWVNVPGVSVTNSIGALMTLTNLGGALQPQGFYRFDITP